MERKGFLQIYIFAGGPLVEDSFADFVKFVIRQTFVLISMGLPPYYYSVASVSSFFIMRRAVSG